MKSQPPRRSRSTFLAFCVAAYAYCGGPAAAAPFGNLDFESAVIGTPDGDELPSAQALPYWTVHSVRAGKVFYDTTAMDAVAVSIQDGRAPYSGFPAIMNPISGSYSVLLQRSSIYAVPPNEDAWIAQTGGVPSDATSLMFSTESNCGAGDLVASLNGTAIPMSLYSVGDQINETHGVVETFIGDIRQFTGQQNVELRLTGSGTVDDIQFSSIVVPEPSTLALLSVAALVALAPVVRRRQSDVRLSERRYLEGHG